ncbi:MAG: YabP/YqfC family sporulation protein [Eubacterium sp.]|nr:YabP/YqfC family sporulation protein [Eubacterium sp.]
MNLSEKLDIPPDVTEGATIINVYGNQTALVENYKSIIEYSDTQIKLQGKHIKLLIEGSKLEIDRFTKEDCKIRGIIQVVQYIPM